MPTEAGTFDVLVVGAGPAGSSLALRLARTGWRAALLDARAFPRSKPCGDAVSPGAAPLLQDLGVWEALRGPAGGGVLLDGWRIRAHGGDWIEGGFGQRRDAPPAQALSMDRMVLDNVLVEAARAAGVTIRERRRVFDLAPRPEAGAARSRRGSPRPRADGTLPWRTVSARGPDGQVERYRARFVVGADGLRSRIARLLGPVQRGPRPRLALVARFEGITPRGSWGELRLSDEGVLGYAPTSDDTCNVTIVLPASAARETRPDPEAFVASRIQRYGAGHLIGRGRIGRPVELTGPFRIAPARRTAPGVLLVGDAAGYFDPFTGQGVFQALFGAGLAANALERCLADPGAESDALLDYERGLAATLRPSRRLQRLIDGVVSHRALMNPAARVLRRRAGLATRLVDATGDRLPPSEILRSASWLGALMEHRSRGPLSEGHDVYA